MVKQESCGLSKPAAPVMEIKDFEIWEEISELTAEIQRDEAALEELKEKYDYQDYFPDYENGKGAKWLNDMTVLYSAKVLVTARREEILVEINQLNWDLICSCVSAENREIDLEAFSFQDTPLAKVFSENQRQFFGLTEIQKHEIHQCVFKNTVELITKDNASQLKWLCEIQESTEYRLMFFTNRDWKPQHVLRSVNLKEIKAIWDRVDTVWAFANAACGYIDGIEFCREKLIPLLEEVQASGGVQ